MTFVPKPYLGKNPKPKIKKVSKKNLAIRLRKPKKIPRTVKPSAHIRSRVSDPSMTYSVPQVYHWSSVEESATVHEWKAEAYGLHPFPTKVSYMTDVVGNPGKFNPVDHWELTALIKPLTDFPRYPGVTGRFSDMNCIPLPFMPGEFSVKEWPWLPQVSQASLSAWSMEAFTLFHDQVPTTVSIPNFLWELPQMKGMIPSIQKSVTKTAAGNFLAFEFGTKPFFDDVSKMLAMLDDVDKRMSHLLSRQGKASDLSFNRTTVYEEPLWLTRGCFYPFTFQTGPSGVDVIFKRQSARVQFHCGAKLFQDLRDLRDSMSKAKALLAAGGFNKPARAFWNAIPYSFTVDWLFSVGKLLDTLTIQPFGGTYDISDVGYSIKSEASYVVHQVHTNGTVPCDNTLGTVRVKSYMRRAGFPATSLLLTDGSLSPKQLVLALAMLEQRRK